MYCFNFSGVIVPGGFGQRGMEGKIEACQWCRETQKPMLGICLGLQAAVIEFARNVLGLKGANSTEVDAKCEDKLVIDMPEHHPGNLGGTMRLGKRKTYLEPSIISKYLINYSVILFSTEFFCNLNIFQCCRNRRLFCFLYHFTVEPSVRFSVEI